MIICLLKISKLLQTDNNKNNYKNNDNNNNNNNITINHQWQLSADTNMFKSTSSYDYTDRGPLLFYFNFVPNVLIFLLYDVIVKEYEHYLRRYHSDVKPTTQMDST